MYAHDNRRYKHNNSVGKSMMKLKKATAVFICLIILAVLFCGFTAAEGDDGGDYEKNDTAALYSEQLEASGAKGLYDILDPETKSLLSSFGISLSDPSSLGQITPGQIFSLLLSYIGELIKTPLSVAGGIMCTALICSLIGAFGCSSAENTELFRFITSLIIALITALPLFSLIKKLADAALSLGNFMLSFVPIYSGILACAGKRCLAASYNAMAFMACELIYSAAERLIVPVGGMYIALCCAGELTPNTGFSGLTLSLKKAACFALGILMTVFTGIMTVSGFISASSDTLTAKTARFLVGSLIPVVGPAMSESLSAITGAMSLLKGTVGVFGAIAGIGIIIPVLISLTLWRISLCLALCSCEILGLGSASGIVRNIGSAVSIFLAVTVCFAALFIISLSCVISVGGLL